MIRNWFSIEKSLALRRNGFFDTKDHLARDLFVKYGVTVHCEKQYGNRENDYILAVCRIMPWQHAAFLRAMAELPEVIAAAGYEDYAIFCRERLDWSEQWLAEKRKAA